MPKTVTEAVDLLIKEMPLRDKTLMANMNEDDLANLHFSLGMHIRNSLGLWKGNNSLIQSCGKIAGEENIHPDTASSVIIRELWKRLNEENLLRVVK